MGSQFFLKETMMNIQEMTFLYVIMYTSFLYTIKKRSKVTYCRVSFKPNNSIKPNSKFED